ncbi:TolC family protein [Larkinella insperata]|uniref:TolC family protein n=1 Tax=Larkinella insperata TaxID=332158 RepID=A0ABW3Q6F1_9BACT|nr:TolC family protein [Larkinella insperata]
MSYGQNTALPNQAPTRLSVASDTLYLDITQDLATQLVPFEEIAKVAVAKSPDVRYESEVVVTQNVDYKLSKIAILQTATGFTTYSFGNQAIISNTSFGPDALGQIANGYRTGVGLQLSLYDLFGRNQKIRQARANYQASLVRKEVVERQFRRELITVYQDMLTAQRLLKLRIQDEQAALTVYRIAEADSKSGRMDPRNWAVVTNAYVQAQSGTEQARGDLMKNVYYLENLVGVSLQQLKRK